MQEIALWLGSQMGIFMLREVTMVLSTKFKPMEMYDPATKQWFVKGNLPENKFAGDAVVLNNKYGHNWRRILCRRPLQQSLCRRPERLRGRYLRPIPQGRQCLRGYALVQAEVADGSVKTLIKLAEGSH